jgi:hypothetical protein
MVQTQIHLTEDQREGLDALIDMCGADPILAVESQV